MAALQAGPVGREAAHQHAAGPQPHPTQQGARPQRQHPLSAQHAVQAGGVRAVLAKTAISQLMSCGIASGCHTVSDRPLPGAGGIDASPHRLTMSHVHVAPVRTR